MTNWLKAVRVLLVVLLAVVVFQSEQYLDPLTPSFASWVALASLAVVLNSAIIAAIMDEAHVARVLTFMLRAR